MPLDPVILFQYPHANPSPPPPPPPSVICIPLPCFMFEHCTDQNVFIDAVQADGLSEAAGHVSHAVADRHDGCCLTGVHGA